MIFSLARSRALSNAMALSEQQLAQFHDEGFLVLRQVLPDDAHAPLRAEIEERVEMVAREAVVAGQLPVDKTFPSAQLDTRLALLAAACADRY